MTSSRSATGGDPLFDHVTQHAVGCQVGAQEGLDRLVGRVTALRIRPARNSCVVVSGAVRSDSWLAHEGKRQRTDEVFRDGVVDDERVECLGNNEWRRPVLGLSAWSDGNPWNNFHDRCDQVRIEHLFNFYQVVD